MKCSCCNKNCFPSAHLATKGVAKVTYCDSCWDKEMVNPFAFLNTLKDVVHKWLAKTPPLVTASGDVY